MIIRYETKLNSNKQPITTLWIDGVKQNVPAPNQAYVYTIGAAVERSHIGNVQK